MISNYQIKQYIKNHSEELPFRLSDDEKQIVNKQSGSTVCEFDYYCDRMRKSLHCDFETIYYEHGFLQHIFRCKECGTVIFGYEDIERYDPDCRCPTCCGDASVCRYEYWTKEEIESDDEKKQTIRSLINLTEKQNREYERRKSRGGLYDWERWRKILKTKKHVLQITYVCSMYDGDTNTCPNPADKYLEIEYWKSNGDHVHRFNLPVNWYSFYLRYVYPYSKKCHPSLRKYHFWQKNPGDLK